MNRGLMRKGVGPQLERVTSSGPVIGYFGFMAVLLVVIVGEVLPFQLVRDGSLGGRVALAAAVLASVGIVLQCWRLVSRSCKVKPGGVVRVRGFWKTLEVPASCLTDIETTEYRYGGKWFWWSWVVVVYDRDGGQKRVVVSANRRAITSKYKASLLREWLGGDASGLVLKHDPSRL